MVERTLQNDIVLFAETLFWCDRAWHPDGAGGWKVVRDAPIVLQPWQREQLWDVFPPENGGRPVVMNYMDSEPKKLGKSTKAAIVATFMAASEPNGEVYICAADKDQAKDRVFRFCKYAVEHGPLGSFATAYKDRLEFTNGAVIQALPMDWKGSSGGAPVCVIFDELHTYTWEGNRRLFDEMIIPPTLDWGIRWVSTYAGFLGESDVLKSIWDTVEAGEQTGQTYRNDAAGWWGMILQGEAAYQLVPWGQGERGTRYLSQAKRSERPLSYRRLFRNIWVVNEASFCPVEWWQDCKDPNLRPLKPTKDTTLWCAIDAAVKPGRDDSAIVALYVDDRDRVCVAWHKLWTGKDRTEELRLDQTVEKYMLEQADKYKLGAVFYDPRFMVAVSQRLRKAGLNMQEVTQTRSVLGACGQSLYSTVQDGKLAYYDDPELNDATLGAVVREVPTGLHIKKGTGQCDLLVSMSFAIGAAADPPVPPAGAVVDLGTDYMREPWARDLAEEINYRKEQAGVRRAGRDRKSRMARRKRPLFRR